MLIILNHTPNLLISERQSKSKCDRHYTARHKKQCQDDVNERHHKWAKDSMVLNLKQTVKLASIPYPFEEMNELAFDMVAIKEYEY